MLLWCVGAASLAAVRCVDRDGGALYIPARFNLICTEADINMSMDWSRQRKCRHVSHTCFHFDAVRGDLEVQPPSQDVCPHARVRGSVVSHLSEWRTSRFSAGPSPAFFLGFCAEKSCGCRIRRRASSGGSTILLGSYCERGGTGGARAFASPPRLGGVGLFTRFSSHVSTQLIHLTLLLSSARSQGALI